MAELTNGRQRPNGSGHCLNGENMPDQDACTLTNAEWQYHSASLCHHTLLFLHALLLAHDR